MFALWRSLSFARWSLRRRAGQFVPIAASFVLLVCAAQAIGALRDVSSVLVQQQIARSWRGSYDLLVRPPSAVSAPERGADWIDPQNMLETYGGIDQQQLASISVTAHVTQVAPLAMVGWQPVDVRVPVELTAQGIYRITATWSNQWASDTVVRFVDVTDLAHLVQAPTIASPAVDYLVIGDKPVVYSMTYQAIQAVMGAPSAAMSMLSQTLSQTDAPTSAIHLALRVERLDDGLNSLPGCLERPACWNRQKAQQGAISYSVDGVQLLRYSHTQYAATAQQLAAGQVALVPVGRDTQGLLYRIPVTTSVSISAGGEIAVALQAVAPVPFSMPQRSAFLPVTPRIIPLEEACRINGASCYSSVYVRLSGAEQYSQRSLALLQATAAAITARTGLYVDILDGSSVRTITVSVQQAPQAIVSLQAAWRVVGVAVQIAHGADALQVMLLALCSCVCLLSIGMAGVLVGISRRKDALLLHQLGWQVDALVLVFFCDAISLCAPGCLLVGGWTIIAARVWKGGVPALVVWMLIGVGTLLYCGSLVGSANLLRERSGNERAVTERAPARGRPYNDDEGALDGIRRHGGERSGNTRAPSHGHRGSQRVIQVVSNVAIALAVFLIAEGYILISSFNQALIVTILGKQVRSALEGSQLVLLGVIVVAALLTVGFCSTLLLRGRREEIQLLASIGWERGHVLSRLMFDCCSSAIVSGCIGVVAALGMAALIAEALPPALVMVLVCLCGCVTGVLLAALATIGIAWQETGRVFRWR